MNSIQLSELTMVETPFLKQLESLGWKTVALDDIAKQDPASSFRSSFDEVVIQSHLKTALLRLNPWLTTEQTEDLVKEIQRVENHNLLQANIEVFNRLTGEGFSCYDETTGQKNRSVDIFDYSDMDGFDPSGLIILQKGMQLKILYLSKL